MCLHTDVTLRCLRLHLFGKSRRHPRCRALVRSTTGSINPLQTGTASGTTSMVRWSPRRIEMFPKKGGYPLRTKENDQEWKLPMVMTQCVGYLLLCNRLSQNLAAAYNSKHYNFTELLRMRNQKSGMNWVVWLRTSCEVAIKMSAGSPRLKGSFLRLLTHSLSGPTTQASPQAALVSSWHGPWLPPGEGTKRDWERATKPFVI